MSSELIGKIALSLIGILMPTFLNYLNIFLIKLEHKKWSCSLFFAVFLILKIAKIIAIHMEECFL